MGGLKDALDIVKSLAPGLFYVKERSLRKSYLDLLVDYASCRFSQMSPEERADFFQRCDARYQTDPTTLLKMPEWDEWSHFAKRHARWTLLPERNVRWTAQRLARWKAGILEDDPGYSLLGLGQYIIEAGQPDAGLQAEVVKAAWFELRAPWREACSLDAEFVSQTGSNPTRQQSQAEAERQVELPPRDDP